MRISQVNTVMSQNTCGERSHWCQPSSALFTPPLFVACGGTRSMAVRPSKVCKKSDSYHAIGRFNTLYSIDSCWQNKKVMHAVGSLVSRHNMKRKEQTRLDGQDRGKEKLFSLQQLGPTSTAHLVQNIATDLSRTVLFFGSHRHCG
jgi:hypothetical protein